MEPDTIQEKINKLIIKYHDTQKFPSDREIAEISIEWYRRDWIEGDMEGIGFHRGVGMTLMRNIIECNEINYQKIKINNHEDNSNILG